MGGGALSYNVSKLGSKEVIKYVSKKLRNFSFASEKACHCEDERSEDVAIAKSLSINEITTSHFANAPRNDKYRHAELVSASQSRRGIKGEVKCAFTLAEVLITLGIIGVVASLTLPSIVHNVQKVILKDQFKRAYSNFYNAIKYTQAQNGAPYACYYWDKRPYENCVCSRYNEYGSCIDWSMADGSPVPDDYNGKFSDCKKFTEDMIKALNTVKFCETKPLENGCITDNYRGIDKVLEEKNPNKKQDPDQMYSDKQIKEKYPTFITADGVLYSRYAAMDGSPYFMMDVNGHKGPNKWGYDIFWFMLRGDEVNGITKISPTSWVVEKGGTTMNAILSGK